MDKIYERVSREVSDQRAERGLREAYLGVSSWVLSIMEERFVDDEVFGRVRRGQSLIADDLRARLLVYASKEVWAAVVAFETSVVAAIQRHQRPQDVHLSESLRLAGPPLLRQIREEITGLRGGGPAELLARAAGEDDAG